MARSQFEQKIDTLKAIGQYPNIGPTRIMYKTGVTIVRTIPILKELCKNDLIIQKPNPKRVSGFIYQITPKGREVLRKLFEIIVLFEDSDESEAYFTDVLQPVK